MKTLSIGLALGLLFTAAPGLAQVIQPVPGADAYVAVPGGRLLADNQHVYRVVFEARGGADAPDHLVPAVNMAGSELNTFAAHGIRRSNVHLVVVFHTTASNAAVLDNAHYRARFGVNNPNLPVLADLRRQGVLLVVCGQSLLADHVPLEAVSHDVTIAEDGVVVLMSYGSQGYAQLVF
jgi:intracellular sulfur oxidation DsrE/DsrF family protein